MDVQKQLFESLRCALWGGHFKENLAPSSFGYLMDLAEEQVVAALVFNVVSKQEKKVGLKETMRYIGLLNQIKNENESLNDELSSFVEMSEANHFIYLIVKGQTIAQLYPNPSLRASGDIDILLKDDFLQSKKKLEKMMAIKLPDKMIEKEVSFYHGNKRYDVHSSIVDFCCAKHNELWGKEMAKVWEQNFIVMIGDCRVRTLPPTLNAIYVFLHLFYHFIREGVALRQFCDWAMTLHSYRDRIDRNHLSNFLQKLDMIKAYRAFGTILVCELGLPREEFPIVLDVNDMKWVEPIKNDIFKGGNFGRKNHKAKNPWLFKAETFCLITRNCFKYFSLAPSELRMMIPKMIGVNWRLIRS